MNSIVKMHRFRYPADMHLQPADPVFPESFTGITALALRNPDTLASYHRIFLLVATVLLWFAASLVSEATHPRIPFEEFKGVITAIHSKTVTVKGPKGTRSFAIKTGEYSFEAGPGYAGLGDRGVTRTQINSSIAIDLNPADVFKPGDQVTVVYWPTLNQGKEAGDIGYSDLEKLRAWNKANKARIKSE